MKSFAFAVTVFALGFTAAVPARADYALVQFPDGYCRIWWDSADNPWGDSWRKIAITPDWASANAVLQAAISANQCR